MCEHILSQKVLKYSWAKTIFCFSCFHEEGFLLAAASYSALSYRFPGGVDLPCWWAWTKEPGGHCWPLFSPSFWEQTSGGSHSASPLRLQEQAFMGRPPALRTACDLGFFCSLIWTQLEEGKNLVIFCFYESVPAVTLLQISKGPFPMGMKLRFSTHIRRRFLFLLSPLPRLFKEHWQKKSLLFIVSFQMLIKAKLLFICHTFPFVALTVPMCSVLMPSLPLNPCSLLYFSESKI